MTDFTMTIRSKDQNSNNQSTARRNQYQTSSHHPLIPWSQLQQQLHNSVLCHLLLSVSKSFFRSFAVVYIALPKYLLVLNSQWNLASIQTQNIESKTNYSVVMK
jgi:hypothetical protein